MFQNVPECFLEAREGFQNFFWKCSSVAEKFFSGSTLVSSKKNFFFFGQVPVRTEMVAPCPVRQEFFLPISECTMPMAPCPVASLGILCLCTEFQASGGAMFGRQNFANHSDSETFGNGVHVQHRAKVLSPWQKWHVHISTLIVVTTSMGACQRSGRATHDQGAVAACARPLVLHAALRTCAWKFSELRESSRSFENLPEASRTFRKIRESSRIFESVPETSGIFQNTRENSREFWKIRESSRMRRECAGTQRAHACSASSQVIRIQKHTRPRVDLTTSTAQSRAQAPAATASPLKVISYIFL